MVAMRNALVKDTFREIKRTLSRFLSIFFISAIGVSFFAGVKAACPDMKITADKYFDEYNLMDIRLLSTAGFNDDDITAVKKVKGIKGVMPAYTMDAMINSKDKDIVLKVISINTNKLESNDESYINRVKLVDGRFPEKPSECLVEKAKFVDYGTSLGSKIKLSSGTEKDISESLKTNEFTIVGVVQTPYYISYDRGTTSIGNGKINSFVMIPEENFKFPVYTDIFLTADGVKDKLCYSKDYDNAVEPLKIDIENTGGQRAQLRYGEITADADRELGKNRKELSDSENRQKAELQKAYTKLSDYRKKLADAQNELDKKKKQFNSTVKTSKAAIASGYQKLTDGEKEYSKNLSAFNEIKKQSELQFSAAAGRIAASQAEIDANQQKIDKMKEMLLSGQGLTYQQKTQMEAEINALQQQLLTAQKQLDVSKAELDAKKDELLNAQKKLENAKIELEKSKAYLNQQQTVLEASIKRAEAEFKSADKKINDSTEELLKNETEYKNAKEESDKKLSDARVKIDEAQDKIDNFEKPVWYVLDRNTNPGFVDYGNAADRMDAISKVFPVFFFLVAALVCLTTMTRMVDEQRTYIGTLKALGYSKASISSKYLLYAALASITGSICGFTIGFKVFPTVIFNAYRIMYTLPSIIAGFNRPYAATATFFAALSTIFAAWAACFNELSQDPAMLMRPKTPKAGKRILLERIGFIWSRFNFTQKITARNLFRYKKRFLMTVIGVGGCTALLLAGFGLKDSIMSIVTKQFEQIYKYNMIVGVKNNTNNEQTAKLVNAIRSDSRIIDCMLVREQSVDVGSKAAQKSVFIMVPEDNRRLNDFITLRVRGSNKKVTLSNDGVVITEKLSKMLKVGIGDQIYIKNGETGQVQLKVTGITENYVSHYVYMSAQTYKKVYGNDVKYQNIVAKTSDTSENFENKLSTDMLKNSDIGSISFTTGISKNFSDVIGSLNYVVLVLIVSAGILAFVVLYNLTNINVTERLREIATIKVLGFYDNEVSAYVYRENMILTLIGIGLGLVLGIFLHRFIVVTSEVEYVMFGRNINTSSYIYSAVMTVFFSGLVNFVMYFRLKRIDMVESLKSVD